MSKVVKGAIPTPTRQLCVDHSLLGGSSLHGEKLLSIEPKSTKTLAACPDQRPCSSTLPLAQNRIRASVLNLPASPQLLLRRPRSRLQRNLGGGLSGMLETLGQTILWSSKPHGCDRCSVFGGCCELQDLRCTVSVWVDTHVGHVQGPYERAT